MKPHKKTALRELRRKRRVRGRIFGTPDRPRLSVKRSNKHISAQLIDDLSGRTLCSAASLSKSTKDDGGGNCGGAKKIGQAIAEKARMQNIRQITFDRNGYRYHGRVKALADAAREAGLEF